MLTKINAEEAVLAILAKGEVISGRAIRQTMVDKYKVMKAPVQFYYMLAGMEDRGLVERIINDKVVEGYAIKEHCFRTKSEVQGGAARF